MSGSDNRCAAFPQVLRDREFVQNVTRLVSEIFADDVVCGEIDEIPIVDAVVAANIEVVKLLETFLGAFLALCRLAHDAQSTDADLMDRAFHELFDPDDGHRLKFFAELKNTAHPDADK